MRDNSITNVKIGIAVGIVSMLGISIAFANGYPNPHGRPDNLTSAGCWVAGGNSIPQSLLDTWWVNIDSFTNVATVWQNPCDSTTDARFQIQQHPLAPNALGTTECANFHSSGDCNTYDVRMDPDREVQGYCNQYNTWCHEVGHSLGLNDNSGSTCMGPGANACTDPGAHWYDGSHEVGHINTRQ